ncbi:MAG: ATP-binding protein [Pseudomonadota bacterium]
MKPRRVRDAMAARVAVFKTTAFKLTAIYMAVFIVFSAAMVAYIWHNATERLRVQLDQAIENEINGMARHYNRRGIRGLLRYIEIRSSQPGSAALLLINHQGVPLEGNISEIPPDFLNHSRDRMHPLPYERRDADGAIQRHIAMVRVIDIENGFKLIVGRDVGEREEFKRIIFGSVLFALVAVAVLGFLSWALVGRRVLRRIDAVSETSQSIVAGDLSGRLPVYGSGDEFDRLAQNVNAMLDRIEALMFGLKDVSDNIAHDLKTPLTRMRNRVDAVLASNAEPEAMRSALEGTITETDQLIRTFDALLKIARVEAGSSVGPEASVDVTRLVADVVELYEPVAEEAGVGLEGPTSSAPVTAFVNRELLSQALANLIDNAIKYSHTVDAPKVTVAVTEKDGRVTLSVGDNGPGIPEADYQRVTRRFARLEKSRSEPGSGLGLSLVAAVAKLHGGTLEFSDNAPGLHARLDVPVRRAANGEGEGEK